MASDSTGRPLEVLVCGGGIAGQAVAFWLARAGHRVVVNERFPALRDAGAQVDLRAQGVDAAERMGLLEEIRQHLVAEEGLAFVNTRGRRRGRIPVNRSGKGRQSLTSEFEIMRGDLVRILHGATEGLDGVEYVFGTSVDRFEQDDDRVTAHFSDGTSRDFDLLIGADGQGSRIRRTIQPEGAPDPVVRLGLHMAYWFLPRTAADGDLRETCHAGRGRMIWRRSHTPTDSQAYFVLREQSAEASAVHREPVEQQKAFWTDRFRDAGWQVDRFLDGMRTTSNYYSQEVVQIRTDTWSKGRVVLVGDAAHCASPFSGMGVSGALVGATVLAGEIAASPHDLPRALASYDRVLRPFVDTIQATVKPRVLRLGIPKTSTGVRLLHIATTVAGGLHLPALINRFVREDRGGDWQLPAYPDLEPTTVHAGAR